VRSRYGSTIQKKNVLASGLKVVRRVATMNPMTTGAALRDARVTRAALRGRVGITTVKRGAHAATQDSPSQAFISSRIGWRYSASAIP
jgi:hypothetical protein